MIDLTKQEFLTKYGHVVVQFSGYRKYEFSFEGKLDNGDNIVVRACGSPHEVYEFETVNCEQIQISKIDFLHSGDVYHGHVPIESFYG